MKFVNDPAAMARGLVALGYDTARVEHTIRCFFPDEDAPAIVAAAEGRAAADATALGNEIAADNAAAVDAEHDVARTMHRRDSA